MYIGMHPPDEYPVQSTFARPSRLDARRVPHHLGGNRTKTVTLAIILLDCLEAYRKDQMLQTFHIWGSHGQRFYYSCDASK